MGLVQMSFNSSTASYTVISVAIYPYIQHSIDLAIDLPSEEASVSCPECELLCILRATVHLLEQTIHIK